MAKRNGRNKGFNIKKMLKNIETPALIVVGIVLVLIISSYIMFGLGLTLVLTIGILIILGIARLLDKMKTKKKRRKVLNILLILFFTLAILVCLGIGAFCIMIVKVAPDFDITKLTKKESSILYDSNGEEFYRFGTELRENISYDDLPEVFIDALIATEDSRFFQHNGVDAPRFIKASLGQAVGNKEYLY